MELHTYSNGIKQQDINNTNSDEDPDKEENRQAIYPTHESFLPEDFVNRRHFLKMVMIGATSVCLPSINAFSGSPYNKNLGPEIIRTSPQNEANPVRFPDGSVVIYYMKRNSHVESIQSKDNGLTWSDPEVDPRDLVSNYECGAVMDSPTAHSLVQCIESVLDSLPHFEANAQLARKEIMRSKNLHSSRLERLYGFEALTSPSISRGFPQLPQLDLHRIHTEPIVDAASIRESYLTALRTEPGTKARLKRAILLNLYKLTPIRPLLRSLFHLKYRVGRS